jgi:hypothetical protein
MGYFDTTTSFAIILLAAIIHASFQLSVSVLTLLSGHALGRKTAKHRLASLVGGFILGAAMMTILMLSTLAFIFTTSLPHGISPILWAAYCGAAIGVGIAVWLFYYRGERGTSLWIPRSFAEFLSDRCKHSKNTAEAFGLGLTSVFAEILFVLAPLGITALVLTGLPRDLQLLGLFTYVLVSVLPLLIVGLMVNNGHKLSRIQRWRENNKRFLQFAAGSGLLVLGLYVYVEQVVNVTITTVGGA